MKQVKFYSLQSIVNESEYSSLEILACEIAAQMWRSGKKVLIACETETQALRLDEMLWQRDPAQFVPHNLSGEVNNYVTPIEITWSAKRNAQRRDILISLQKNISEFVSSFNHIIEFVPTDEQQKEQARERYRQYRQMGFEMKMEEISL